MSFNIDGVKTRMILLTFLWRLLCNAQADFSLDFSCFAMRSLWMALWFVFVVHATFTNRTTPAFSVPLFPVFQRTANETYI